MNDITKLAIHGGQPIRTSGFPAYSTIGNEEKKAVIEVLESGVLSQFLGMHHKDFYGGQKIREFEEKWSEIFNVKHTISVNSATSGLYAAVGACGISPGDEVIVSPYTMSASATAPLLYGAIPIFADIDPRTFTITPESIEKKITSKTKAIIVVDIFGQPADYQGIKFVAEKYNLKIIEDAAQAPYSTYEGRKTGTLGDIGVYSLNYHKHIHTGEGGMVVTNDDELALRLQLIRNHAEAVVGDMGVENIDNLIGYNYRMTEIEAAIGIQQLKKLPGLIERRQDNAEKLTEKLSCLEDISTPYVSNNATHVYYIYPLMNMNKTINRKDICKALREEGIPNSEGYVKPLYLQPIFQKKIAYGHNGYPFSEYLVNPSEYDKGSCPIVEDMHYEKLFYLSMINGNLKDKDIDDIYNAFEKVISGLKYI